MDIYLVGGAVRDELLGLTVGEKDWMITGVTPDEMIAKGYRPVGKDFPVFLHPQTHEEYALARTEKKEGHGYGGFVFYTSPGIGVEQDLARRDLTVNAIAKDSKGRLIDPFGGVKDMERRILRHVSPAFVEDPLRILRVARLAARFHGMGFTVAPETMCLMREMVCSGELEYLSGERIWQETLKAFSTDCPDTYFSILFQSGALAVLFPELSQNYEGNHTPDSCPSRKAMNTSAKNRENHQVIFACAFLPWSESGEGIKPEREVCGKASIPKMYREIMRLVREIFPSLLKIKTFNEDSLLSILEKSDAFRRKERFRLCLTACQYLLEAAGEEGCKQIAEVETAWRCSQDVDVSAMVKKGFQGQTLAKQIRQNRLDNIRASLNTQ